MGGRKIDESNVDEFIEELKNRTTGKYINQGVAFNKNCKRQMALLRNALMDSSSFSGLIKEMLAVRYSDKPKEEAAVLDIPKTSNAVYGGTTKDNEPENNFSGWV
ncbi:hypothetical protein [Neobacillus cucumis]|uniref:hypothetical protein n=1 Tax=Neobacillus cucumis TaxID=1740721 RepID=UPI00285342EB|nr:hypothetical protein [Neobacillus cucumis]MDR4945205.1 hypothetical protein [Neobacillus cucumis]